MLSAAALLSLACLARAQSAGKPVDGERITNADAEPGNWLSYGRTYSEQRFSPLARINDKNVQKLGLAWFADLDTNRAQEATPLIVDGVMYISTAWSLVKAYDARSGKLLWAYDPQVHRELGVNACCDVGNRGVAAWNHKIFVGAYDGRLVALDDATGKVLWSTMTVDPAKPYTITQAPRVIKGRVIIGNSGGEYGARGYISAYDAETGKLAWRFFTVPGDPSQPFENQAMARAAKTWSGEWWKLGGGGPVWDAISYDPKLNLLYFGTGNGVQWARSARSAGKGDNLYLASIVALHADTGEYAWHYQATPGEEWDFDAVQQLVLADLNVDGKLRQVLMQANKNGFFYVLDRKTGALISAKAIVPVTWASGVDIKSGRPIENKEARYSDTGKPVDVKPGPLGAHNWQPMAFNVENRSGLHSGATGSHPLHAAAEHAYRTHRLEFGRRTGGANPAKRRIPACLGSGASTRSVARDLQGSVEWRRGDDRRQHRRAGRRVGKFQCVPRGQWREVMVDVRAVGNHRRAEHL